MGAAGTTVGAMTCVGASASAAAVGAVVGTVVGCGRGVVVGGAIVATFGVAFVVGAVAAIVAGATDWDWPAQPDSHSAANSSVSQCVTFMCGLLVDMGCNSRSSGWSYRPTGLKRSAPI